MMNREQVGRTTRIGRCGRLGLALLLALVLTLGHPETPVAQASTFTVNSTLDEHDAAPGNGLCASAAGRCTLRAAIEEANATVNADTISLPAGTYTLTLGELVVINATTINGAGATNTIVEAATTLSAARTRVFMISSPDVPGEAPTVRINQLTIRHGNDRETHNNLDFNKGGGGIFVRNVLLFLQGTIVTDNEADHGAGIQLIGPAGKSRLSLVDGAVTRNRARLFHGGILCQHANNDEKAAGPVEVFRSRIDLNQSPRGPGGLSLRDCSLTMEQSTVALNRGGSHAGGVFAQLSGAGGFLTMRNVTISSNLLDTSNPQGPSNLGGGGGVMLSLNSGGFNGAHAQDVLLDHVTFANNELRGNFEGAHNLAFRDASQDPPAPGTTLSLRNTIFVHNLASRDNCFFEDDQAIVTSLGGNVEFPRKTCTPNPAPAGSAPDVGNSNPRLGPLANNGGPTQTHALTLPSRAVDLIPGSACLLVDQRGLPRPVDGNGDGIRRCDSGAFEVQPPPVGTFTLAPSAANVAVGQRHAAVLTWTVPEGSWQTLESVQVRLREDGRDSGGSDEAHTALQFHWDQDAKTVHQVDPKTGRLGPPAVLGSETVLESARAMLYLKESSIKGGGEQRPDVAFTMSLGFKPPTKGWTYTVEVAATNDSGASQDFAPAGTITVDR